MDDEIDTLLVDVRASTAGFRADIETMRGALDATLVDGFARAGGVLERGLLSAIRKGSLGFDDLKRVALDALGQIAAQAVQGGIDSLFGASQLMMQSIIAMKLKVHRPHVFLAPEVGRFKVLDFLKAAEVLEISSSLKDDLKRALDAEITRRIAAA